ncbi:hypothetical protein PMZ80_009734, partial [Knufia obscura]
GELDRFDNLPTDENEDSDVGEREDGTIVAWDVPRDDHDYDSYFVGMAGRDDDDDDDDDNYIE